jgi:hypothetical protein
LSDWEGVAGGTLLVPSGATNHLFVIVLKSSDFGGYGSDQCISVNVTSIREGVYYDNACVLEAGCHPFITHDSYVLYSHARIDSESHLKNQVSSGRMAPKEPVDNELLAVIVEGLKNSLHTKKYLKELIK